MAIDPELESKFQGVIKNLGHADQEVITKYIDAKVKNITADLQEAANYWQSQMQSRYLEDRIADENAHPGRRVGG